MVWTSVSDSGRSAFRRGLPLDDVTWARGRGWALWKALVTLAREKQGGESANEAAHRFGWRCSPHEVIADVIGDASSC
jgi:hypothetical protein